MALFRNFAHFTTPSGMQNKQITEKTLVIGIIISMFFWGLGWPSGKVLSHFTSPVNFSVYRYILVATTLSIVLLASGMSFRIMRAGIPIVIISGVLLAAYSYFFVKGLQLGAAGAGGVLVTTLNPIVAYTVGIFLNRKLPSRNEAIGLVLGLIAGVVLLQLWSNAHNIFESGNIFFLLSAFTWAIMSKFTSKGAHYGSSMGFSFWQYVVTLLCLMPLMNVQEAMAVPHITSPMFWGNLFFGAVVVTTLATTVYFYTTTRLGAEKASSFIFLVPLAAAVSSWLILGEKIMLHTIIGGLLGMVAVYMINKKKGTAAEPEN